MSISIITKSEDITINEVINNECIYDYINRVLEHFEDKNNITIEMVITVFEKIIIIKIL